MKQSKYITCFVIIFFLIFLFLFYSFSLSRLYSLQIFHYDFGIFAKIIWQLSRLQLPIINHRVLGDIFFLGDHFNPSLVILAPLFWITSDIRILLFEQALFTVLSGLMIYLVARKLDYHFIAALIFTTIFLLFAGTENPLVTDWHPEPTAGFFLLLFFYLFNFTKFNKLAFLSALIFLGFKESNALTLIFLLVWMYILQQNHETRDRIWNKKCIRIVFLAILSLGWFFLTTKFFIPFFSHQKYMYSPDIPLSPIKIIGNYLNNPLKTKLIFDSFISFGFLPLFSVFGLIPIFLELGIRLIPNSSIFQNFALTFHYNVYLGIFLALATIYGVKNIRNNCYIARLAEAISKRAKLFNGFRCVNNLTIQQFNNLILWILLIYLLLFSLYTARKITSSPINLAISPIFWHELRPKQDFYSAIKLVPYNGSVMAQNNLLPYFVTRKEKVYLMSEDYTSIKPGTIVFDISSGQNINNFWDTNYETILKIKEQLLRDKNYERIIVENKNLFIFQLK